MGHNLPARLTSFIGRERELAEIGALLDNCEHLNRRGGERVCLDAPVIAHSAANVAGQARLCLSGPDLFVTSRISGLRAGAVYTTWLSYVHRPALCYDVPYGPIDLLGVAPIGLLERIDGGVVPPSGTLQLAGELRDLEISSGAQVTLLLMRPRTQDYAHAEAVFIVP